MVSHCGFNLHLLVASDAEHPLICLWVLCMSSLEKCLFKFFAHFLLVVCLPGVESCEFFIYFGDQTLAQGILANIFTNDTLDKGLISKIYKEHTELHIRKTM